MYFSIIVAALVPLFLVPLFLVPISDAKSFECPKFMPTTNDMSQIVATWYFVQTVSVNIDVDINAARCQTCHASIDSVGRAVANSSHVSRVGDESTFVSYTITTYSIDHNKAKIAFITSLDPSNADLRFYLDINADYFIYGFCQTVNGVEGYTINVYSTTKTLSAESMVKVKKLLRESHLVDTLKPVYQGPDC